MLGVIVKEIHMTSGVRDRMIAGAVRLLARRGLQATSFSTVLAETGAPRGSIYHHFPGGKDELVAAAIDATERHALRLLDQQPGASARQVAESFLGAWRALLTGADFDAGCALVAVTVAADSPHLRQRTADGFRAWRGGLARALHDGGLDTATAESTALLLLAASEGAVLMCRAEQDIRPFDTVAATLLSHIGDLTDGR
jgi:TetR/AcrR family transcriptional repressor of lmrAB and yxaGH operons